MVDTRIRKMDIRKMVVQVQGKVHNYFHRLKAPCGVVGNGENKKMDQKLKFLNVKFKYKKVEFYSSKNCPPSPSPLSTQHCSTVACRKIFFSNAARDTKRV